MTWYRVPRLPQSRTEYGFVYRTFHVRRRPPKIAEKVAENSPKQPETVINDQERSQLTWYRVPRLPQSRTEYGLVYRTFHVRLRPLKIAEKAAENSPKQPETVINDRGRSQMTWYRVPRLPETRTEHGFALSTCQIRLRPLTRAEKVAENSPKQSKMVINARERSITARHRVSRRTQSRIEYGFA